MSAGTPLEWARETAPTTGLQSWSWALAIVLALAACGIVLWWRARAGSPAGRRATGPALRRLGGTRLSPKVTLEVIEFGGQRLLLAVSDAGARELAREPVAVVDAGSAP
ncbi:flagellar biosynthetic protein FliO [Achromobacter xylosoxidans]|uniref:flagellar biosynthetic protein FliO n=1 Tax=Alcaligenes xylosoxydans xylosoxydans TaxID=85698 RepID=UPI0006C2014E|nr:flagellar biosynthetic protein FliO [Achromobacter xylosoxidans]CUI48976.1 flagellar biosynthetic protein FliO [Achromobacter xylosoxidans]